MVAYKADGVPHVVYGPSVHRPFSLAVLAAKTPTTNLHETSREIPGWRCPPVRTKIGPVGVYGEQILPRVHDKVMDVKRLREPPERVCERLAGSVHSFDKVADERLIEDAVPGVLQ